VNTRRNDLGAKNAWKNSHAEENEEGV